MCTREVMFQSGYSQEFPPPIHDSDPPDERISIAILREEILDRVYNSEMVSTAESLAGNEQ